MTYYAYQQNAKNTYAKYVSIKMLHICHAMQFITILCRTIAYQQILQHYYDILCMSTKCHKHICKYVLMKMLHTCHAMQSATILCHIIVYQQDIAKY
jgi:hypothetical protein